MKFNKFLCYLLLLNLTTFHIFFIFNFETLSQAKLYSKKFPEYPISDNDYYINPNFTKFHNNQKSNFLVRSIKNIFNLYSSEYELISKRLHNKLQKTTETEHISTLKLSVNNNAQIIVFGNIHGAFHSLIRNLSKLKSLNIINNNLKITNPNYYIVFNGNAIDYSAYNFETLDLILTLMLNNPDNVFYIQGSHENKETWKNHSLNTELKTRDTKITSLDLKKLFDYLPKTILFYLKDNISPEYFSISYFNTNKNSFKENPINIKAKIIGENNIKNFDHDTGLYLLTLPGQEPANWTVVSSPVRTYRTHFNFHYDAFARVLLKKDLQNSTIASFYNNLRLENTNFKLSSIYNLTNGEILCNKNLGLKKELKNKLCKIDKTNTPNYQKKVIYLGSSLDLTKGLSTQGKLLKQGMSLYFNYKNRLGGINGNLIRAIFMDDEYNGSKARQNILNFTKKYKSNLLVCPLGTPTLQGYIDLVKQQKVFVFFPETGSILFRNPELKNIVHWRPSTDTEGNLITDYVINNYKPKSIALFYQNDDFGISALNGAKKSLENLDLEIIEIPYNANQLNVDKPAQKIINSQPQAIGFLGSSSASAELIRKLPITLLTSTRLFGITDLSELFFQNFLKRRGLSMITAQMVPNIKDNNWELIQTYKNIIEQQNIPNDPFLLNGYISAALTVEILSKIKGKITNQKILEVLNSMHNYNFQGMQLDFNAKTRELAHYLWIDIGSKWTTLKSK